ncbi:MAG: hypothetical protein U0264_11770 [Candidatus Kapaibacterium sp.]
MKHTKLPIVPINLLYTTTMNYDIKIVGEEEDNGLMEFDRLNLLTASTKEIATMALMLRLHGFSEITPDKQIKKALELKLRSIVGDEEKGTLLTIDCRQFASTIIGLQYEIFKPKDEVLQMTPMSLVIDTFRAALSEEKEDADIDKPLLKSLMKFKRNFTGNNQVMYLSNRGSIPEVRLTKADFNTISDLEESIPEPRKVIVNGQLDEMKVSKGKLGLQTAQGIVHVFSNDSDLIQRMVEFMGKEVTITGKAHYKPNGRLSFIDIQEFRSPNVNDRLFSKSPNAMTARQQLLFQAKQGKKLNPLSEIVGMWPGDETDEEFAELLQGLK